jgi:hypothetical protein
MDKLASTVLLKYITLSNAATGVMAMLLPDKKN